MPVSVSKRGDIAIVTIDNPPVNATSLAVRQGLQDALSQPKQMQRCRLLFWPAPVAHLLRELMFANSGNRQDPPFCPTF